MRLDRTAIIRYIKKCKNVIECNCVTGDYSMLLEVLFENTMELDRFIGELQYFGRTKTLIVFSTSVEHRGVLFPLHAPQLLLPRGLFPSLRMRRLRQKLLIVKQPAFRQSSVPHCLLHRTPRLFFMSAVSESAMLRQFLNIRMSYPSRILHPLRQVRAFPVYL